MGPWANGPIGLWAHGPMGSMGPTGPMGPMGPMGLMNPIEPMCLMGAHGGPWGHGPPHARLLPGCSPMCNSYGTTRCCVAVRHRIKHMSN